MERREGNKGQRERGNEMEMGKIGTRDSMDLQFQEKGEKRFRLETVAIVVVLIKFFDRWI